MQLQLQTYNEKDSKSIETLKRAGTWEKQTKSNNYDRGVNETGLDGSFRGGMVIFASNQSENSALRSPLPPIKAESLLIALTTGSPVPTVPK